MNKIMIKELLVNSTYPDAGALLFQKAKSILSIDDKIIVDMDGVDSIPTMFMNTSFGELINSFGIEKTRQSLVFLNISRSQFERIKKYFTDCETVTSEYRKS